MAQLVGGAREDLTKALGSAVRFDVSLADLSYWRIGGTVAAVVEPENARQLEIARRLIAHAGLPSLVIGATSNLLFDSAGFDGVLIRIATSMSGVLVQADEVVAKAGTDIPIVARAVADAGLTGLEHIVGIPGTLGGLIVMNGGSQRKYIGSNVVEISGVAADGSRVTLPAEALSLGYRTSGIEGFNLAITEVRLRLSERDSPASIHQRMDEILAERAAKFPLDLPSCGSTFLSNPAMYATVGTPGRAIEAVGLKGLKRGHAQISPRHANFIVNLGGATSDDVLWLIRTAQASVEDQTGYRMASEARYVARDGTVIAADLAARQRWTDLNATTAVGGAMEEGQE